MNDSILYFAFGSNLLDSKILPQLHKNISSSETEWRLIGIGTLNNTALVFDKKSNDGSSKANLSAKAGSVVWGKVIQITSKELAVLDKIERGYVRTTVDVQADSALHSCLTYVAERGFSDTQDHPYDWYVSQIIQGAIKSGLPTAYIDLLTVTKCKSDPNSERARIQFAILDK